MTRASGRRRASGSLRRGSRRSCGRTGRAPRGPRRTAGRSRRASDEPALEELLEHHSSRRPRCPSRRARRSGRTPGRRAPGRRVRAVDADRALVPDDRRAAHRARGGHDELALVAGPLVDERADDLGDDVAGLLEDHPVADPDVLAADLVEVVERGPGDGGAGDLGRREVGDRCQRPRPPDVRDDVLDDGLDLLGRELVGDRPARRPADHPEPLLLVEPVDLDDDAVGLVRQLVAGLAPALGERDDALDVETGLAVRVDRASRARRGAIERRGLAGRSAVALLEELVRPGREQPAGGDRRVLLAQRARARVARIGVERQARLLALGVDPHELGLGHEHLAADVGVTGSPAARGSPRSSAGWP